MGTKDYLDIVVAFQKLEYLAHSFSVFQNFHLEIGNWVVFWLVSFVCEFFSHVIFNIFFVYIFSILMMMCPRVFIYYCYLILVFLYLIIIFKLCLDLLIYFWVLSPDILSYHWFNLFIGDFHEIHNRYTEMYFVICVLVYYFPPISIKASVSFHVTSVYILQNNLRNVGVNS